MRTCSVDGCQTKHLSRGFCATHYTRWRKTGSTDAPPRNGRIVQPVEDRFWAKVDKSDAGGCWVWTGAVWRDRYGYGKFQAGTSRASSHSAFAHRVAWELSFGSVPPGLFVCHHCDNPPCVRPDHLFLGTQTDNMADMVAKGRWRSGRGQVDGDRPGEALSR